jgi:hypothetical protein
MRIQIFKKKQKSVVRQLKLPDNAFEAVIIEANLTLYRLTSGRAHSP